MATRTFKQADRVALAEDISYRGHIYQVYSTDMVYVQWDKSVLALYLNETLLTEKEANELQAKIDAEKPEIKSIAQAVVDKFSSIFGSKQ